MQYGDYLKDMSKEDIIDVMCKMNDIGYSIHNMQTSFNSLKWRYANLQSTMNGVYPSLDSDDEIAYMHDSCLEMFGALKSIFSKIEYIDKTFRHQNELRMNGDDK